jgi:class 3 adenylate cyclase
MDQQIRFCTAPDGVQLAYAVLDDGPRTTVYAAGFPAHLEQEWTRPSSRTLLQTLAAGSRLIRYDMRGCGLSDSDVSVFSLETLAEDLGAVADAAGAETFVLLSMGMLGAPTAITYAAAHPDRVSHLVICSGFACGARLAGPDRIRSLIDYTEQFGFPALDYMEAANPDERVDRTGRDVLNIGAPPALQAALLRTMFSSDTRELLPRLTMPATVIHGRGDRLIPLAEGRALAAALPRVEFVPVEGNTVSALTEKDTTIPAIRRALAMEAAQSGQPALRTVLFTDLVGHTEMMQRLGDVKGRDVLREHERITRATLRQHGGAEVKTMGDGFMASFASVTSALDCAIALQRAFAAWETEHGGVGAPSLQVRVGLNAGEPIEEDGDLFGATVILASRVAAQAGAGEILIPEPVRHLLAGKAFVFADRGQFALKGFDDAVRLFEVRWRE